MRGGHRGALVRASPEGDIQLQEPERDPEVSLHGLGAFVGTFISL